MVNQLLLVREIGIGEWEEGKRGGFLTNLAFPLHEGAHF